MERNLTTLATAVIAGLDASYNLVFVDQGDQLTDEQVEAIVENDFPKLFELTEQFESDARDASLREIVTAAVAETIQAWENEDDADYSQLADEFELTDEWESVNEAVTERDNSDWLRQLAAATPDVLLRINVFNEDDAYDHEAVAPEAALVKVGLPVTASNVATMAETLANASPEFSVLLGYWIVGADVEDLHAMTSDATQVQIVNPHLYLGNPFAGSGFISEVAFEGTVTVKREDLHTDKGAFGYGVDDLYGGLNASQYRAEITPVAEPVTSHL